ncbi:MAG: hypothetical protein WCK48_00850 [bacterium]
MEQAPKSRVEELLPQIREKFVEYLMERSTAPESKINLTEEEVEMINTGRKISDREKEALLIMACQDFRLSADETDEVIAQIFE